MVLKSSGRTENYYGEKVIYNGTYSSKKPKKKEQHKDKPKLKNKFRVKLAKVPKRTLSIDYPSKFVKLQQFAKQNNHVEHSENCQACGINFFEKIEFYLFNHLGFYKLLTHY